MTDIGMWGAQIFNLSVSVQIVAGRYDFAERGSMSRSTMRATDALDLSKRWADGKVPAVHRPALLWLRFSALGRNSGGEQEILCTVFNHADNQT